VAVAGPTLFHNPQCSKSRGAKAMLDEAGVGYEVVEYLKAPPSRAEIERIIDGLDDPPAKLVRTGDPKFKALGLDRAAYTERDAVVDLLVEHPEVMERPVLLVGDRAVIGRPPERVHELLVGG
jgi:arsenate reductase (glutaredoxin)